MSIFYTKIPQNFKLLASNSRIASGVDRSPYGVFYFSHEGTLGKVMARLGLFRDSEPLRADNFIWNIGRQWRTARVLPFASNMVFVLFR